MEGVSSSRHTLFFLLELHMHTDAYSVFVDAWYVSVGETTYIIYLQYLEDVLYAE